MTRALPPRGSLAAGGHAFRVQTITAHWPQMEATVVGGMGRRLTEPVDVLAQAVARRAIELVVEALDVNVLLGKVDVNRLLADVDVNRVLDNVDVNRLLDHVDVNRIVSRVDVAALVDKVDVNEIVERVDVNAVVERTELKSVLAKSSTTVFIEGIDLVRSQAVGLDDFMARWVNRILRRKQAPPLGPPRLLSLQAES